MSWLRSLLPALLILSASLTWAQDEAAPAGPRLFVKNKRLDFGEVVHGRKVEVKVPLQNRGTEELVLTQVKPSCGCTVAKYPERLAPGARGSLVLEFDSSERPPGFQSFRIAVYSNDPNQKDMGGSCTLLNLRGEVRTLYKLAPHGAYFGEFIRGLEADEKVMTVTGIEEARKGFKALLQGTLPDYMQVTTEPLAGDRAGHRIRIRMLPHAPLGQIERRLTFATGLSKQPTFQATVTALVSNRIVGPDAVMLGQIQRLEGRERLFALERRDKRDGIPVVGLEYDRSLLKIEHKTVSPRRVECKLEVVKGAPPGPFATAVQVFLDDPDQRLVRIMVYGQVLPRVQVDPPAVLLEDGQGVVTVQVPSGHTLRGAEGSDPLEVQRDGERVSVVLKGNVSAPLVLRLYTDVPGEEEIRVPIFQPE